METTANKFILLDSNQLLFDYKSNALPNELKTMKLML